MSAAGRDEADNAAAAIKARAAEWLEQRDRESWSSTDQTALEDWLAKSMSHKVAFWRLDATWERTERLVALRSSGSDDLVRAPARWPALATLAFIAVLFVAVGAVKLSHLLWQDERVYATAIGGHKAVTLSDGSQIELNTDTQLRVNVGARGRLVLLDRGEAYFQIKHDTAHPFVVMAGNRRIMDLGTKFLVRLDADRLRVSLLEGRAQFDATDAKLMPVSIEMNPGDVVVAEKNFVTAMRRPMLALTKQLSWRRGRIVFDNTMLADAAAEFNRYGGKRLVIADGMTGRLRIDGTFQTGNVEAFADAAQDALGLHVSNRSGEVVISR